MGKKKDKKKDKKKKPAIFKGVPSNSQTISK